MRALSVFYKKRKAGVLTQLDDGSFTFAYSDNWLLDAQAPALSFGLPKQADPFISKHLFPVFYHLLPEGANRVWACKGLRLDLDDDIGLLLHVAKYDTVGAITIQPEIA